MSEYHHYRCDNCGAESKPSKGWMGKQLPFGWLTLSESVEVRVELGKKASERRRGVYAQVCGLECAKKYIEVCITQYGLAEKRA